MSKLPPRSTPILRATKAQVNYMQILFNDLGFASRKQQIDFCILRNIDVRYLDEMTVRQGQAVIGELLQMKSDRNNPHKRNQEDNSEGLVSYPRRKNFGPPTPEEPLTPRRRNEKT